MGNEGDNKGKGGNIEANNDGESQERVSKLPSKFSKYRLSLRLTPQEFLFKLNSTHIFKVLMPVLILQ